MRTSESAKILNLRAARHQAYVEWRAYANSLLYYHKRRCEPNQEEWRPWDELYDALCVAQDNLNDALLAQGIYPYASLLRPHTKDLP